MSETAENTDSGKTSGNDLTEEAVVKDDTVAAVGDAENKEMTVDLEVKGDASLQKNEDATEDVTKETVEVKIEGVPVSMETADTEKVDNKNLNTEKVDTENVDMEKVDTEKVDTQKIDMKKVDSENVVKEKEREDLQMSGIDTAESEKEMEVNEVPVTDTDSKVNTDDTKKSAPCKDLSGVEKEKGDVIDVDSQEVKLEAGKDTEESKDTEGKGPKESETDLKLEEKTVDKPKPVTDDTENKEAVQTPNVTPTKGTADQTTDDKNPPAASNLSLATKKTDVLEQEAKFDKPFPESLAKLRNLTVNIGPIRQMDLKSEKLHEILKLTDNFEIKFELRDKKDSTGKIVQEKSGFVRLPFEITTPTFLIRVAYRLGNLHIDGRDMSVKFPDAFNKAVMECQQYIDDNRKFRAEKFEQRKRQIAVKNVPPNVTEDTMRSLFPEAQKITLNMEDLPDGGSKVGSVLLEFDTEEACVQCLDTNKDVFVEDCQLKIFRLFSDKTNAFQKKYKNPRAQQFSRGRGQGRGRGVAQRGGHQAAKIRNRAIGFGNTARGRGGGAKRGGNFGRKQTNAGQSSTKSQGAANMGPPDSSPRDMVSPKGRGQRNRTFSGSKPGKHQRSGSYEGQFKDFTPKRESNRGRQRNRRGQGRGNNRNSDRSPSFRGEQSKQSPYRGERSSPYRSSSSYRTEQRYSSQSASREEDPMAVMQYLKSTIARMEEKMTGKDHPERGYGNRHEDQSRSSQYSPRGRGSPKRGRGRGWGDQSRKRPAETRDYGHEAKRQYTEVQRRDLFGNLSGGSQSDYRYDLDTGNSGDIYGGAYGSAYGGNQTSSYGNRGYSDYDTGDRNKRDNYGGQRFNSGYSGGGGEGQFGGRGGGRGRGYKGGNKKGQW